MRYTLKHIYKDYQDCYTDDLDKFLHTNIIQEFNIMIMDYVELNTVPVDEARTVLVTKQKTPEPFQTAN